MGWIRHCALVLAMAGLAGLSAGAARADGEPSIVGVSDLQGEADWTGFYIGGKLGGTWGNVSWTQDASDFNPDDLNTPVNFSPSGFSGGIIGGGNLQIGHWVFGIELAYIGVDLTQSAPSPFPTTAATDTFTTQIDWLGTIEGRIGYSFHNFLLFAKGGWVGTNATLEVVSAVEGTASAEEFVDGWTIGGGLELLCWSNIVLGIEYDYTELNLNSNSSCPLCVIGIRIGTPQALGGDATLSSVMVRASYLFMPED